MKRVVVPLQQFVRPGGVVVALPLYKQVPVAWLFNWLLMGKSPCVGLVGTDGVVLPLAMERMVGDALAAFPLFEWLVVFEHDMVPPLDAFDRVMGYGDGCDVVGSMYFMHEPPHGLMACDLVGGKFEQVSEGRTQEMIDSPGLYRVDGVAMGFTAIRRRVLVGWDVSVPMWQPLPPMVGHDLHFCFEAVRQGFSVHLDSGLRCQHLTEVPIGWQDRL